MKRLVLDGVMLILFFLVMCFAYLPRLMHEVLGVALPLAVLLHLYCNRAWFSSLRHGRLTRARIASTLINILLIVVTVAVIVTGLCISNYLVKDIIPLAWQRNIFLHQLHVSLPYAWLILLGLHTGLHWPGLWGRLSAKISVGTAARIGRRLAWCAVPVVVAVGIYGSFLHRIGDRLLLKHIFHTPALEHNFGIYLLLLWGVFGLYVTVGFALTKLWQKK